MRRQHIGYEALLMFAVMALLAGVTQGNDTESAIRVAAAQIPVTRDIAANTASTS